MTLIGQGLVVVAIFGLMVGVLRFSRLKSIRRSLDAFVDKYSSAALDYEVAIGHYGQSRVVRDLNGWAFHGMDFLDPIVTELSCAFKGYRESAQRTDPKWDSPEVLAQSLAGMESHAIQIRAVFRKLLEIERDLRTPYPLPFINFVRFRCERGALFPETSPEGESLTRLISEFEEDFAKCSARCTQVPAESRSHGEG